MITLKVVSFLISFLDSVKEFNGDLRVPLGVHVVVEPVAGVIAVLSNGCDDVLVLLQLLKRHMFDKDNVIVLGVDDKRWY